MEATSERVHERHTQLAKAGHVCGGRIFGYKNDDVVVGVDAHEVRVGMRVEVEFVAFDDELTLPQFHPAPGASS